MTHVSRSCACLLVSVAGLNGVSSAQAPINASFASPALDRWVYAFGDSSGTRSTIPVFAAMETAGFDDRDAQMLLGFDTGAQVATGRACRAYQVTSLRIRATVSNDLAFQYDPTFDELSTYPNNDPALDPGRPIEMFVAGYRNGFDASTFVENSPFGGTCLVPPAEGCRNVFAGDFGAGGEIIDVSRNVRLGFEITPIAIGTTDTVNPGAFVPEDTEFVFDVSLSDPDVAAYLQRALSAGRLNVVVASLHQAAQGGPVVYPIFYSKENALGVPASLEIEGTLYENEDWNLDGTVDAFDYDDFVSEYFNYVLFGSGFPDYNCDGTVDAFDYDDFVSAFLG